MFPLEIRAMAIALFYAISTGIGGAVGPLLFGKLLGGDDPTSVAVGYWIAAGLMGFAALVEIVWGVDAEQQSLEDIAEPLSAQEAGRMSRQHLGAAADVSRARPSADIDDYADGAGQAPARAGAARA